MENQRLFFQLAAGLIPALLFGGLITGAFVPHVRLRRRPKRERRGLLVFIILGVAAAVLAEFFAIDLATSPNPPSSAKVTLVVGVVVAATALAGVAVLMPWLVVLGGRGRRSVTWILPYVAAPIVLVGIVVLSDSIVDAEIRLGEQRLSCLQLESGRERRQSKLDLVAAEDAVAARRIEVLELEDERLRLRQETGLTQSDRKSRGRSLTERAKLARFRHTEAGKHYVELLTDPPDDVLDRLRDLGRNPTLHEQTENFLRAYGC